MTKDGHMSAGALVKEAIVSLKERTGSSSHAIRAHITKHHGDVAHHLITIALKSGIKTGKLVKVKNSYKLNPAAKAKAVHTMPKKTAVIKKKPAKDGAKPKKAHKTTEAASKPKKARKQLAVKATKPKKMALKATPKKAKAPKAKTPKAKAPAKPKTMKTAAAKAKK